MLNQIILYLLYAIYLRYNFNIYYFIFILYAIYLRNQINHKLNMNSYYFILYYNVHILN